MQPVCSGRNDDHPYIRANEHCHNYISDLIQSQTTFSDLYSEDSCIVHATQSMGNDLEHLLNSSIFFCRSRESANLEYLKNVCLRFILTDSDSVKQQMSLSLSTILMFSPAEVTCVVCSYEKSNYLLYQD